MEIQSYQEQEWKDLPDTTTPITAERLNHMENGIKNNNNAINKSLKVEKIEDKNYITHTDEDGTKKIFDGIIPRYEDENGANYIKKPGGVLICWGHQKAPDGFKHNTTKEATIDFPIEFIEEPSINLGIRFSNSLGADYLKTSIVSSSNSNFVLRFRNSATATTGYDFSASCDWFAIGKWK